MQPKVDDMFEKYIQLEQKYYIASLVRTKGQFGIWDQGFGTQFFFVFQMIPNNKMGNCNMKMSLPNCVTCVLRCQCGLSAIHLRAYFPKACQFLIFTCQRANKRANVPYVVPMFQLGLPMCQIACQFFKSCILC